MGGSSCSLLDESKISYVRGRTEAELKNFSPHYRRQSCVAFFSHLKDEVEQHRASQAHLLKQKESLEALEVLYKDSMVHFEDNRKWRERFVVIRTDYSLELHDSLETFTKGAPARHKLLTTGGTVLTSEEKYNTIIDKDFPDPNGSKEDSSVPMVVVPGPLPVYLRLPYRRDLYFCFQQEEKRARFVSILNDSIRHQNQDYLKSMTYEVQALLKAIHFYRQEKGHYESWDMLVGTECQVLANLVMEELLPSLQTELFPKLKGKKTERKRVWLVTVEATYDIVQEHLREGLENLKKECRDATRQQEALIRSDMDQIINSQTFLETKLQALVSDPALKYCSESVAPYLASILEELMGPVSTGFQAVRLLLEDELTRVCKDFPQDGVTEELQKALQLVGRDRLDDCYQHVNVLKEQLQELRNRFKFSNSMQVVHYTQNQMQQLFENAVFTFELLLETGLKDKPDKQASLMEKAKLRVLKQFDYDSSTVRKKIFQDALVDITLPAIRRNLAAGCKTELSNFEQFIFADYTNFVQVDNVYENILLNILNNDVIKVVKEAASLKKNNLFGDSTDLHCVSQSSLTDSRTPPLSAPSSPPVVLASVPLAQQAEHKPTSALRIAIVEETGQKSVIPSVTITVSSPESEEPTAPSSVVETVQPDVLPTSPEISSSPVTKTPDISLTEAVSTTSDVPTKPASVDLSSSEPQEPLSDKQGCSAISSSSSESSDQSVCLISTGAGSPVPPALESENIEVPLCASVLADEESKDTSSTQSEIEEACIHHVQPDVTKEINAEVLPDLDHIVTPGNTSTCNEKTVADIDCDVVPSSEERNEKVEEDIPQISVTCDSVPDVPVEDAVGLTSELNHSSTAVCTDAPEAEETADSVKAIKDLIMEVIEVEDEVRPWV
ncbi:protein Niban 1 [Triplophysa dalaica]|uniref:protein Niban 1 n=1 Tax=Triplophysa dalaica TaxID=1582913 RepID=UPI0024E00BE5|nr:protein Niban 1 [Triplophysa dalaica]